MAEVDVGGALRRGRKLISLFRYLRSTLNLREDVGARSIGIFSNISRIYS